MEAYKRVPDSVKTIGQFFLWYREAYELSQRELGVLLGFQGSYVGFVEQEKYERPTAIVHQLYLRLTTQAHRDFLERLWAEIAIKELRYGSVSGPRQMNIRAKQLPPEVMMASRTPEQLAHDMEVMALKREINYRQSNSPTGAAINNLITQVEAFHRRAVKRGVEPVIETSIKAKRGPTKKKASKKTAKKK